MKSKDPEADGDILLRLPALSLGTQRIVHGSERSLSTSRTCLNNSDRFGFVPSCVEFYPLR